MEITKTDAAARRAVLAFFFGNGAIFANWVVRIPEFQARYALGEGELGLVLMCGAAGTMAALVLTSGLIARFGSRKITTAGALGLALGFFCLPIVTSAIALAVGIFFLGAGMSVMDVAMNTQAAEVERRYRRPIMSSFHAAWSLGGFFGAALGAGALALSIGALLHFGVVAAVFVLLALSAHRALLVVTNEIPKERERVFQLPPTALWPLGLLALCAGVCEGAMGDWSAVYLKKVVLAEEGLAALGFTAFSIAMAAGRITGDRLSVRLGSRAVIRAGGILAALGLMAAALWPTVPVVMTGFVAVGLGLANAIPLAFSTASNTPNIAPSKGIAGVATIGYAGFLIGPPCVGLIAELSSLRASFVYIALLAACVTLLGRTIKAA